MCLELEPDIDVIGEAGDAGAALRAAQRLRPDVVVMDVVMPDGDGLAATRALRDTMPECAVVVLSIHDGATVRARASAAGASEFVAKHEVQPALVDAIRRAAGRTHQAQAG